MSWDGRGENRIMNFIAVDQRRVMCESSIGESEITKWCMKDKSCKSVDKMSLALLYGLICQEISRMRDADAVTPTGYPSCVNRRNTE